MRSPMTRGSLHMVSGALVGMDVPASTHDVMLEYRTGAFQIGLTVLGACALAATVMAGRRFVTNTNQWTQRV
jgi:hypothetical protein